MPIKQNIAARDAANDLLVFADELAETLPDETRARFWAVLAKLCRSRTGQNENEPSATNNDAMTDADARRFGNKTWEFGKFEGEPVNNIPIQYLEWYADNARELSREVSRYLQSRFVRDQPDE